MPQVKSPKWDKCIMEEGVEIQDASKGQERPDWFHLEIGMAVCSRYKGILVFTKIESVLENRIKGNITRIDSEGGEAVGDLSLGNKVLIPFEYICSRIKEERLNQYMVYVERR